MSPHIILGVLQKMIYNLDICFETLNALLRTHPQTGQFQHAWVLPSGFVYPSPALFSGAPLPQGTTTQHFMFIILSPLKI